MSQISNINDALKHYRSNAGGTVPGTWTLIQEMENDQSFRNCFNEGGELYNLIKNKIIEANDKGIKSIKSSPGSYRGLRCTTLGSYKLEISYDHKITKGPNNVKIKCWGSDRWDFEYNNNKGFFHNLKNEIGPKILAGKGTPFDISYSFEYIMPTIIV